MWQYGRYAVREPWLSLSAARFQGGPGCSSLVGLLQENGPFQYQPGTFAPTQNPYSWSNLTNMLYIEQPIGVGFSQVPIQHDWARSVHGWETDITQGTPNIIDENGVAEQVMGFFKNFVDTFSLQDSHIYLAGESYGGYYVPYVANGMLDANDTTYFDLKGIIINDPSIGGFTIQGEGGYMYSFSHYQPSWTPKASRLH